MSQALFQHLTNVISGSTHNQNHCSYPHFIDENTETISAQGHTATVWLWGLNVSHLTLES